MAFCKKASSWVSRPVVNNSRRQRTRNNVSYESYDYYATDGQLK